MVSIPSVSSKLIRTCTCCTSMLVRDDRMSSSSLAQTILSRLDLTSVSEGDCLLSDQPLDLTSVPEGDRLLSKQASVRNLHVSSRLQNAQDQSKYLNLPFESIIASSVSEGDVLSSRVTVSNLSNSGSIPIKKLDAQDVHRISISWPVLSGPTLVWHAESTALRLCEQTSRLLFICKSIVSFCGWHLQRIWSYFMNYESTHHQQNKTHDNSLYPCLWAYKYNSYSSINRCGAVSCNGKQNNPRSASILASKEAPSWSTRLLLVGCCVVVVVMAATIVLMRAVIFFCANDRFMRSNDRFMRANDRFVSRSIAPLRSFAFAADRDLFGFSRPNRDRNKFASLRSTNICSPTSSRSTNICSRSTATSFVKFLALSRVNQEAATISSTCQLATSFVQTFYVIINRGSLFVFTQLIAFGQIRISGNTFTFWNIFPMVNYFSLHLHFTRESENTWLGVIEKYTPAILLCFMKFRHKFSIFRFSGFRSQFNFKWK